jgi:hypothetical protein
MDQNSQVHRDGLNIQIKEAYGRVVYTYTAHWKMVDALTVKNRRIKYTQIALSAISTGGFIGSIITNETALTCIGGIFSTLLLALNLYFKDFDLNADITRHSAAANALWSIREAYVSLLTDFPDMTNAEICARRDELQAMTAEAYKSAPKTDSKSYSAAQNALKKEEEQFFSREELNLLLPEHLREK